jgi:hypothetical protein
MKYVLLIYSDERRWATIDETAREALMGEYIAFTKSLAASGALVANGRLKPTATATSVRVRDGHAVTTDGPFAETREQLGGFYLVEAKDLDEATGMASRLPGARFGTIEVRPVLPTPSAG